MTQYYEALKNNMKLYLEGTISAEEIVRQLDDFVSLDYVYELNESVCSKIMNLQDEIALYVSDLESRKEHNLYLNDIQLKVLIKNFLSSVE